LNDHFDILGGGTVHSFKFLEYLSKFYDVDVYVPKNPKTEEWMKVFLNLETKGLAFYKYAKGIGKKYNYMFLNISHWRTEETNAFKKYMLVFFPQFFFPLYDYKFLANSEYTKKHIIKLWKKKAKEINVVYPPIMTSQFKSGHKQNIILHVSRITPPRPEADKGHVQMIETFKKMCDKGLKDWEFHLVGQIEDQDYYNHLLSLLEDYPIRIQVSLPFKKLQALYKKAKIYWHLTGITLPKQAGAQEHFGMTIVEAMSSGAVPVSLNTGGPREIIDSGLNGHLIKDAEELKLITDLLIEKPKMLAHFRKEAIKRAESFNEEVSKKQLYSSISQTDKVSIVILCWNNSKYTKTCVDWLYKVTPPGFELILVDNNSTDDTHDVLKKLQTEYAKLGHRVVIHKNPNNFGFAKGNNVGLQYATRPYVCYLNNDTIPQWGWLEKMIDVLETDKKTGVVGARLYFPQKKDGSWMVQHSGISLKTGSPKHIDGRRKETDIRKIGVEEMDAVTGACMLVRKKLAKFNEKFIRGYYEDVDLCLRARQKKYKIYINHEARLIHHEGVSQNIAKRANSKKFKEISQQNKKLFHSLWEKKMKKLPKISKNINTKGINHPKKIEIGGGENPLYPNYKQVDLRNLPKIKYQNDARALPFPANSLSDICACYILQCLSDRDAKMALKEWHRCLKPGGKLEIHVPDLNEIAKMFISTSEEGFLKEIYGEQQHELDFYKSGWNLQSLERLLSKVNFVRLKMVKKPKHKPYSLSLEGYKQK